MIFYCAGGAYFLFGVVSAMLVSDPPANYSPPSGKSSADSDTPANYSPPSGKSSADSDPPANYQSLSGQTVAENKLLGATTSGMSDINKIFFYLYYLEQQEKTIFFFLDIVYPLRSCNLCCNHSAFINLVLP